MEVTESVPIAAPPERVWQVLADEFAAVSVWAARMLESFDDPSLGDLGGRQVVTAEYGAATETLYRRDDERRALGYWVTGPSLPAPISDVQTEWRVVDGPDGGSTVAIRFLAVVEPPEVQPMLEQTLRGGMHPFLDQLRHYAETGEPHPGTVTA